MAVSWVRSLAAAFFMAAMLAARIAFAQEAEAKTESAKAPGVELKSLIAPILNQGRLLRMMYFSARLQVEDEESANAVGLQEPRIRDGILRVLNRQSVPSGPDDGGVDLGLLSKLIEDTTNGILGRDLIQNVTINRVNIVR